MRRASYVIAATAVLAALGGCANSSPGSSGAAAPKVADGTVLTVGDTKFGDVLVDGKGMTVYYYTPDTPNSGKSACTGDCLAAWPPVHADSKDPKVDGVTAKVGTIMGNDGKLQVTVAGHPVYLYAGDAAPGDVKGQGIGNIWWVVEKDGDQVTAAPSGGSEY
jgi:predicted lipoprotein with Yx(FWY)xxD motif